MFYYYYSPLFFWSTPYFLDRQWWDIYSNAVLYISIHRLHWQTRITFELLSSHIDHLQSCIWCIILWIWKWGLEELLQWGLEELLQLGQTELLLSIMCKCNGMSYQMFNLKSGALWLLWWINGHHCLSNIFNDDDDDYLTDIFIHWSLLHNF